MKTKIKKALKVGMVALGLFALLTTGCSQNKIGKKAGSLEDYIKKTKYGMTGVKVSNPFKPKEDYRSVTLTYAVKDKKEYLILGISFPNDPFYPNAPSSVDLVDFKGNGYGRPDAVFVSTSKGRMRVNLSDRTNLGNSYGLYDMIIDDLYREKIDSDADGIIDKNNMEYYIKMLHTNYNRSGPIPQP